MKNLSAILFFALVSVSANANLTAMQLEEFKNSIKQGCIKRGGERNDENAVIFCTCMGNLLRTNLSDDEFQEIAYLAITGKKPFVAPAFKALLPQIAQCKVDVDG